MIRKLDKQEYHKATALSLNVYTECGKDDFEEEGYETFKSFVSNEQTIHELTIYGAFENESLIGIIGTKKEGKHISLFFVHKKYHRKGIGKRLFSYAINDCPVEEVSVNSSTFAISFYQSLGFEKTSEMQITNGLKYTPMKLVIRK